MPAPLVASEPRDVLRGHVPRSHGIHVEELLQRIENMTVSTMKTQ